MKAQKNWEFYFQDAILSVEELLSKHNVQNTQYSKLKIALDNRFLTWFEYKEWAKDFYGVPVLSIDQQETVENLKTMYLKNLKEIVSTDIWTSEMIALDTWDHQLIILGLEPKPTLNQIDNYIFILTPPEIIEQIISTTNSNQLTVENKTQETATPEILITTSDSLQTKTSSEPPDELETLEQKPMIELRGPDNIDLSILNIESANKNNQDEVIQLDNPTFLTQELDKINPDILNFEEITTPVKLEPLSESLTQDLQQNSNENQVQTTEELSNAESALKTDHEESISLFKNIKEQAPTVTDRIWNNLAAHHDDYASAVRKQFDAYLVLRITPDETTEVYKMDEDLAKEEINFNVFKYDLKKANPFQNVYKKHFTETFNVNQLGLTILDFKYACVSVIKLGRKVVGFLVGFKTTHLSQEDISTLESISEKVV